MDEATFYPDAHPETSSVDANVWHLAEDITWANLQGGAGTHANDASTQFLCGITADPSPNLWYSMHRAIAVIDISDLPPGCTITGVVFSIYGWDERDDFDCGLACNIFSSAPASDTAVVPGDFNSLGTTPYCDTPKTLALWSTTGYNDFTFNAAGIAAVQAAADGDGKVKLGFRESAHDVADEAPPWVSSGYGKFYGYGADEGVDERPKLKVTYTPPAVGWTGKISGVTNPAKIMGVAVANIKSVKGVE